MKNSLPTPDSFTAISGLAHELDAPLKSILVRTHKLINEFKNRDFEYISYKDFKLIISTLEQMERQLEHCSRTTSRMLFVGKRQARLIDNSCQINDIIKIILEELNEQLKTSRIKIIPHLNKNLPKISIGPIESHQIVHNIIINAMQAMPSGGSISIKSYFDKIRNTVEIEITDQGVGMTADQLARVYEPFFTTKERGIEKSSGLGLSIIYSIINAAGGSIHIKSSLRKGTVVHIALPVLINKSNDQ